MQEEKTDIQDIDELDQAAKSLDDEPKGPAVPEHLVEQPCGLPKVLMDKKELIQYELDHGIDVDDRNKMEVTGPERQFYDLYVGATRGKGVTKKHFIAALRYSKAGFDVWPNLKQDINDMKVF